MNSYIVGDAAVIQRLETLPTKMRSSLKVAILRIVIRLQRKVKAEKLSGQVLNVRTGTLRRSIDQRVTESTTGIVGRVSTNVKYGKVHEYGFAGAVNVPAHLRQIKEAFGRSINPVTVEVRPHVRRVNLPERSFLRSALKDMEQSGEIKRELASAIREGLE